MSVSNLLVSNNLDVFSNSVTTNAVNTNSIVTTAGLSVNGNLTLTGGSFIGSSTLVLSSITAAATIGANTSGSIFQVLNVGGVYTITLPSFTTGGLRYTFTIGSTPPNAAVTVHSPNPNLYGVLPASASNLVCTAKNNVIFGTGSMVGDSVTITTINTNLYTISGFTQSAAGITFS